MGYKGNMEPTADVSVTKVSQHNGEGKAIYSNVCL